MKQTLKKHLINLRGKKLKEKFLVLESDDWGAIRIPNIKVRDWLYEKNNINKKDPFSRYDTLESENDYEALFEVLNRFIDCRGNHPILTANFIMNNPDFDAIKSNDFKQYYSQPYTETYKSYYGSSKTEEILREGINNNLVKPQFHGTEHLNVVKWMNNLNQNNASFREAFDLKCYAVDDLSSNNRRGNLMAAYDYDTNEELEYIRKSIVLGLEQFEEIFGFKSLSITFRGSFWGYDILKRLNEKGIILIGIRQFHPISNGKHKFINNKKWGDIKELGQIHLRKNRELSLQKMETLLKKNLQKIPDVKFIITH